MQDSLSLARKFLRHSVSPAFNRIKIAWFVGVGSAWAFGGPTASQPAFARARSGPARSSSDRSSSDRSPYWDL